MSFSKALTSECRTLRSVSILNSPFLSDASFKCLSLCKRLRKIRVEGKLNEFVLFSENVFLSVSSLVIKQLRMSQVRLMLINHSGLLTANFCLQLTEISDLQIAEIAVRGRLRVRVFRTEHAP